MADKFATIDDYIASKPMDVQPVLESVRRAIRKAAPQIEEAISYQIPTFKLDGKYLVYFGAWKKHFSIYPVPHVDEAFAKELAQYRSGKGTLQFGFQEAIPYDLIERVVAHLLRERLATEH